MTPITTERLVLRNFRPEDAHDLLAYLHRPRVSCFFPERLTSIDHALTSINERNARPDGSELAVCLASDGPLIGNLFSLEEEHANHGVGWHFNAAYTGKGYAAEAARAYFAFLFAQKQARRIYAYVEENNLPSQKLCERLGMRREGLLREFAAFATDQQGRPLYENTLIYAVLRKEWSPAA